MYFYFGDFDSHVFASLHEELDINIDCIFRIEELKKENATPSTEPPKVNNSWAQLKARSSASEMYWRQTLWRNFNPGDFKDVRELFDLISNANFDILGLKKKHEQFYQGDLLITPTVFDIRTTDLRYYKYLFGLINNIGLINEEFVISLLLENISHLPEFIIDNNTQFDPNTIGHNDLKEFFDNMFSKLIIDSHEKPESGEQRIEEQKQRLIEIENKSGLLCKLFKKLKHVNLNPDFIIKNRLDKSITSKYVNFTKGLPGFSKTPSKNILAESMSLKTEFFHRQSSVDCRLMDNLLTRIEFEKANSTNFDADIHDISLKSWQWNIEYKKDTLLQVISRLKLSHPCVNYRFSSYLGQLLVTLTSPGPIGALEYSHSNDIKVLFIN
jgi:hypothetical protein